MTFDIKTMGERVRELRKAKNISTEALADSVGVTSNTFGFYERGERLMPVDTLIQVAEILDCDVTYLIDSEQTEPRLLFLGVSEESGLTYKAAKAIGEDIEEYKAVLSWFIEHDLMCYLHGFLTVANAEEYPEAVESLIGLKAIGDYGRENVRKMAREFFMHDLERLVDDFIRCMKDGEHLRYTADSGEEITIPSYGETRHVITRIDGNKAKYALFDATKRKRHEEKKKEFRWDDIERMGEKVRKQMAESVREDKKSD